MVDIRTEICTRKNKNKMRSCSVICVCNVLLLAHAWFLCTVWRETLEGANFGEIARKTSLVE